MKKEDKAKCYQEIYDYLNSLDAAGGVNHSENDDVLTLTTDIGMIRIDIMLYVKNDLLVLKSITPCGGKNVADIMDFGRRITADEPGISAVAYDEKLIITANYPFNQVKDSQQAKDGILNKCRDFMDFLISHSEEISGYTTEDPRDLPMKKQEPSPDVSFMLPKEKIQRAGRKDGEKGGSGGTASDTGPLAGKALIPEETSISPGDHDEGAGGRALLTEPGRLKPVPERDEGLAKEWSRLQKEKDDFKQYREDKTMFLKEREEKARESERKLEKEKEELRRGQETLRKKKESFASQKEALDKAQLAMAKKERSLADREKAFKEKVDRWNKTTPDERLYARREELKKLEDAFYEKESDFQLFQQETLDSISRSMQEATEREEALDAREKELAMAGEKLEAERRSLGEVEAELKKKEQQLKEKAACLGNRELELSDKEAEIKRAEIMKKDAENKERQLTIIRKNLEKERAKIAKRASELEKEKERYAGEPQPLLALSGIAGEMEAKLTKKESELEGLKKKNADLASSLKALEKEAARSRKEADTLQASLEDKDIQNAGLSKELKQKEKENEKLSKDLEESEKDLEGLRKKIAGSQAGGKDRDKELSSMRIELFEAKERIRELEASKADNKSEVTGSLQEGDLDSLRQENLGLKDEITVLRAELDKKETQSREKDLLSESVNDGSLKEIKRLEGIIEQLSKEKAAGPADMEGQPGDTPSVGPVLSIEDFSSRTGIELEQVIGEIQGLFHGTAEDCDIYINEDEHIIQVDRDLRKGNKYTSLVTGWNSEDMGTSYSLSAKHIMVRSIVREDYADEIQAVLARVRELK